MSQVTVIDDQWIRTHDEARDLLKYSVIGATVVIERVEREHCPETRAFTVVLDGATDFATSVADCYSLPCLAGPLARRARDLADKGTKTLAAHRATLSGSLL